jgi:hypothetical protein
MPTGILTLHIGHSEGALLQALALTELLEEVAGEPVDIVDHRYWTLHASACGGADRPRKPALEALVESWLSRFDGDHRATWRYIAEHYGPVVVGREEVWR